VHALTHLGKARWIRELGGKYQTSTLASSGVPTAGENEVFVWLAGDTPLWRKEGIPEKGPILKLNGAGEVIATHDLGVRVWDCRLEDLDRNGQPEVLATDRNGYIHMLGSNLVLKRSEHVTTNRHDEFRQLIAGVADLDADMRLEKVLINSNMEFISGYNLATPDMERWVRHYHENSVVVISADLKPLARHVVGEHWGSWPGFTAQLADFDRDGRPEILALSHKALILKFRRKQSD
jgi:hypothetical protein